VAFGTRSDQVRVVDHVSFDLARGGSIAIIGESGSGKTTLALAIAGLVSRRNSAVTGKVLLDGVDLLTSSQADLQRVRGRRIGFVFQDPLSSLNPVKTVGSQVAELFRIHQGIGQNAAMRAAIDVLARVQIPSAERRANDYPHQFSGGMRQRVMIAIALALQPDLLIADEPTTALDVTVQAQIIELLGKLSSEAGTTLLLISHDLGVAGALADRLAVMYGGRLVEVGPLRSTYHQPFHPYTRGLLASGLRVLGQRLVPIPGSPPRPSSLPSGCAFHPRCAFAAERCRFEVPALREIAPGRFAACHFAESIVDEVIDGVRLAADRSEGASASDQASTGKTAISGSPASPATRFANSSGGGGSGRSWPS
jgi:oligopeptide/dipeptide ABC transporter ATP-binding protein